MKYLKYIQFTLIALIITDSLRYIAWSGKLNIDTGTYISIILNYASLAIMIFMSTKINWSQEIPRSIKIMFSLWMINNIVNLIRAFFLAADYWDWKVLVMSSESFSLIPLAFFLGLNLEIAKIIFRFFIKYAFVFGFILIPLALATNDELYSRIMIPIVLFILFIPYLKSKWKLLLIIVAVTSIFVVIDFRSNIIKITFSSLLLFFYYFQNYIKQLWIRFVCWFLYLLPIIMLALAITGNYNVFQEISNEEDYNIKNSEGEIESMTSDTRTFLYEEVITSVHQAEAFWFGKSAIGSYYSEAFTDLTGTSESNKRFGCEVGILNFYMRYGIIGVTIYFLFLSTVSFYAINRSNNTLSKMLGLFVAFRWTFSFVEEFTQYDLNFYFFWVAVGFVSSVSFRKMNDDDLKKYFELI